MSFAFRQLHPDLQASADFALEWARYAGIPVTVTSVWRSSQRQAELRAQYEGCLARGQRVYPGNPDARCRYPANKPGDSSHEFGFAWDSDVPDQWMPTWIAMRRYLGWTVPDNDPVHAEVPGWRAYVQYGVHWDG